ncbi:MAG: permease prefix domain 1-containing protein [Solirubrobacteraceae bacterium]
MRPLVSLRSSARRSEPDPIGAYLQELEGRLRARRIVSRRALSEVRAHLVESAEELARRSGSTRAAAEREAVERFGDAAELARDLDAARRRRSVAAHRFVTLWVAWAAAMAMGSATVWAAVDLQSTSRTATRSLGGAHAATRSLGGAHWVRRSLGGAHAATRSLGAAGAYAAPAASALHGGSRPRPALRDGSGGPSAAKRRRCDHARSVAESRCDRAPRTRNGR